MGKPTGFIEYERQARPLRDPLERINDCNDFHLPLCKDAVRTQASRCMNCGIPFCQSGVRYSGKYSGCPLHNLIPEYNDELYLDNWQLAWQRLSKTNNFPEFTGRVCPALCENACVCRLNGEPVTCHDNEYAITEEAFSKGLIKPEPPKVRSDKNVAVIGSGPAGLAAADCLNKRGHNVTVFERDAMPGGLLMYGIPSMKLEKDVIKRRIDIMKAEGVVFKTGINVGAPDPSLGVVSGCDTASASAKQITDCFDAVILACGSKQPRDVNVPGRDALGICFAVDFLSEFTLNNSGDINDLTLNARGKNVVIVGGGDTGNDCVAVALREGAASVVQLDRNPKAPEKNNNGQNWPLKAGNYEMGYGQQEAYALYGKDPRMFATSFKEIIKDKDGNIKELVTVGIKKSFDEKTKKRIINIVSGSEKKIPCDMLILAAGFEGCQSYVADAFGLKISDTGTIQTLAGSYKTDAEKIFTAGDAHRGQSLVVWAISEGRACAKEVDEFLMGYSNMF